MGEVFGSADQPGAGLGHGLKHQDAGHDGEARKVVGQVFLGQAQILDGDQALTYLEFEDSVDQHESHGSIQGFQVRGRKAPTRDGRMH